MLIHFWLELNTYKNIVIEQEIYSFNMQTNKCIFF